MNLNDAIASADAAAALVWERCGGPSAFGWRHALAFSASMLAQYLLIRREASAEQLYAFSIAGEPSPALWADLPPPLRVAIEVFRATFLVLLREVESVEAREREAVLRLRSVARIYPISSGPRASDATRQSPLVKKGRPT